MTSKICFVISPIGAPSSDTRKFADKVLDLIIKPAVNAFDYLAVRSDEIAKPGDITTEIIQHLVNDPLVIADLTGHNPNVFYELAIRHATRRPVISIAKLGETIPFDVLQFRTAFFDIDSQANIAEGIAAVRNQVSTVEIGLKEIVNQP